MVLFTADMKGIEEFVERVPGNPIFEEVQKFLTSPADLYCSAHAIRTTIALEHK